MPTADVNLDDEMVKLVAYTIVSLKPDHEDVMGGGETIVAKKMSGDDFTSWMLAKYVQSIYPKEEAKQGRAAPSSEDLKYLRVYFVVSTRWPREPRRFEKQQIDILQGIEQRIP